jgi:hypothetical protein
MMKQGAEIGDGGPWPGEEAETVSIPTGRQQKGLRRWVNAALEYPTVQVGWSSIAVLAD